jgi:cytochrome P450
VLGNTVQFLRDPAAFHETHVREHGDVVRVQVGRRTFHYVTDPAVVGQVLGDRGRFRKASVIGETAGGYLGDGLFFAEGDRWRRQREAIDPSFYPAAVERYATVAVDHARGVADWADGERVRVDETARELALGVLAESLFSLDTRTDPAGEVIAAAADGLNARLDATNPGTYLPEWLPTPARRRSDRASAAFDALVDRLIAERRGGDGGTDLLGALLTAHEAGALSASELRDGLETFLFAGHDTTALTLTYTWYLLAGHPAVGERLRAELDDRLDGDPEPADLRNLPYLRAVIDESMRLYPPAYMVLREPVEPVELGGYRVPAGATLILPQQVVHRDPRWWDEPEQFRPGRFLGSADRPEYAYFPFGGGPRRCIGARLAVLELTAVLATVARRVRFEDPPDGLAPEFAVTLQPGREVTLTARRTG